MFIEEYEITDGNIIAYIYPSTERVIDLRDFEKFLKENDRLYYEWTFNEVDKYGTLTMEDYLENTDRHVIMDDLSDYCEYDGKDWAKIKPE